MDSTIAYEFHINPYTLTEDQAIALYIAATQIIKEKQKVNRNG